MTNYLLQICAFDRFSCLLDDQHHLAQATNRALVARASAAASRIWRRRASKALSTPLLLHKRRLTAGFHSLQKLLQRRLDMASHQELRRRSSAADRAPVEPLLTAMATATTFASSTTTSPTREELRRNVDDTTATEAMPPPPAPADDAISLRRSRTTSISTRNANRLSLTLPIAPPTSDPSRPTPTNALPSLPGSPAPASAITTPSGAGPNEFIIAIAAQERKVLELREQLAHAEAELTSLKRQWTLQEGRQKKVEARRLETQRALASEDDSISSQRLAELDRRKILLQGQTTPTTPGRRRVIRGGHARTLSLLSPVKTDSDFSTLQNTEVKLQRTASQLSHHSNYSNFDLPKRASWQPRTQTVTPSVPSFVEDFRIGFRAFVEDIRQITVGDEPITGQALHDGSAGDQDTVRATPTPRPKVSNAFDLPSPAAGTPTPSSSTEGAAQDKEKAKLGKNKHFSWTPLTIDSLDDNGWSNWESPASTKSARWSGSTINSSSGTDHDTTFDTELSEDAETPSKPKPQNESVLRSPKLEEILPTVVNRLKPSNIKRTANHLLDEWEKSLTAPDVNDKENTA
ncbi:hypothetical protein B0I35DRAFT_478973 [Stachybotrys elegans]|uniref:DUF4048 domain-containing protein n=1 Tax=Stachybotrys elegans TaxID=80388 RepID=A0A8K0SRJ1_9HYPO|nr:hypothetical protein B0I35DRAFT_478973 [Stachybotrys elegans]